jgi:hypothetical protein
MSKETCFFAVVEICFIPLTPVRYRRHNESLRYLSLNLTSLCVAGRGILPMLASKGVEPMPTTAKNFGLP